MATYDVIVIGARVAGSPTAMLLARRGYRVLLVDRATFPSDAMSTHLIHPPGMAALARWGLAERIVASGCPPVHTYRLDLGEFAIAGRPRGTSEAPFAYAPRRVVLDHVLVEAAAHAGAEVREGFSVDGLIVEDGGVRGVHGHGPSRRAVSERARVVVGADGVHSFVARAVRAAAYQEVPAVEALYLAYWSGLPVDEFQIYLREDRGLAAIPTNDDLTVVLAAWPIEQFERNRRNLERSYLESFDAVPQLSERLRSATRESRIVGTPMDNFYRRSHGPGWALVGDAGYHKDACTAQGITDAFREAERLTNALDDALSGRQPFGDALRAYELDRDRTTAAMYDLTCQLASFDPPSDEMHALLVALSKDPSGAEDLMSTLAGTMPVEEFLAPDNTTRYVTASIA